MQITSVDSSGRRIPAAILGGRLRVLGIVRPYIGGQVAAVRFFRRGRQIGVRYAPIRFAGHNTGHFVAGFPIGASLRAITVRANHGETRLQAALEANPLIVKVVPGRALPGDHGVAVRVLQRELNALHYAVPLSGRFDAGTGRAVTAFRKLTGLARTERADRRVFELLARGAGGFHVRHPEHGKHFEADLSHQVLAEVLPHGHVRRIYTMSSGKPSTPTVIGTFHIYERDLGTNHKGMVDSNFFIRGYAIHGYPDVPPYAASHGCLRVPIPDARPIHDWAQLGEIVDVYTRSGGGSHRVRHNAGP
jgi:hypothetical protein